MPFARLFAWLIGGGGVLFVEAVDHGGGHVRVHLNDDRRLPPWIYEGGDREGWIHAATVEPPLNRFL